MVTLDIVEAEAGGDIGRVVVAGFDPPPGDSVAEQARQLRDHRDELRRRLISPPLGDPSQSINLVVPTQTDDVDVALIITGTMGYPGFSGSNAMCTMAALVADGTIDAADGDRLVRLETPAGITPISVSVADAAVTSVSYPAPLAYVETQERAADVSGWGMINFSLAYSGVSYVVVDSAAVGLQPSPASTPRICALFDALFTEIVPDVRLDHPELGILPPLTLGLLADSERPSDPMPTGECYPLAVYMAGGVICEGPTGTGTSALLAWLARRGRIRPGARLAATSPTGNSFIGTYSGEAEVGPYPAVHTTISGTPTVLGRTTLHVATDA